MKSRKSQSTKHHPGKATISRKRKVDDPTYHPPGEKRKTKRQATEKKNILVMRTDNRKSFIDPVSGEVVPLKTFAMPHWNEIQSAQLEEAKKIFSPKKKTITSDRPVTTFADFSPSGKPRTGYTPGGSKMTRKSALKSISFFDNLPTISFDESEKMDTDIKTAFFSSKQYQQIRKITDTIKKNEVRITRQLLEQSKEEFEKNNFRRSIPQNKVMVEDGIGAKHGGATAYAQAAFELNATVHHIKWEWLHLVAHCILGDRSQDDENLVGGTRFSNTEMMLVESQLHSLAERYSEGFTLDVSAKLIPGTHLAKEIQYTLITPDFKIPFSFNAQTTSKPHIVFADYMKEFMESLVDASQPSIRSPKK